MHYNQQQDEQFTKLTSDVKNLEYPDRAPKTQTQAFHFGI